MSMKTRRKTKALASASEDAAPSSPLPTDDTSLSVTIPDDLDVDTLSTLIPNATLAYPSPDTILALYRLALSQVADLDATQRTVDELRAQAEKTDVELDQALQDKESLSRDLGSQLEATQTEVKELKQERDQLVSSQVELKAEILRLSTTQSTSSTELDDVRRRLEDSEREKRDVMAVVSRLKQDETQREEEIQTLRKHLKDARQEHQTLENQVRELRSTETSTKFKLESLSQQLELSQSEVERTNSELTSKSEEFTKYRRAKQAEVVTLQANLDAVSQSNESSQSSLKALQSSHTSQTHQLTQALTKVQDLNGQLAEQEATFTQEITSLRRLVTMLEEREKEAKDFVSSIEKEWDAVGEKADRRESALRLEIERERKGREDAEKQVERLEIVIERMSRGELPVPGRAPGTPVRGILDESLDGMMGLSPTVAMASKAQKTGKTFTEVYADYVRLQEDYAKKSAEYDHMDRTLTEVLAQIEERAPILSQQRIEYERLQTEAAQLASQLAQALSDRDSQVILAQENAQKLGKSQRENTLLEKQRDDLGRQVQNLLREIGRRDDPTLPAEEENSLAQQESDVDVLITNNLVLFRSINGLQEQNQKLLAITRELAKKLEDEEKEYRTQMEQEQNEAVQEAHAIIKHLEDKLENEKRSSEKRLQTYVKERDTLAALLARSEKGTGTNGRVNGNASTVTPPSDVARELAEIQNQFEVYRTEMGIDSVKLREDLLLAQKEVGKLHAELAKEKARSEYYNERNQINQDQYSLHARELDDLGKRNQQLFDQWTRVDIECGRVTEDLRLANSRVEQLRNECANLRAEKKIWDDIQRRLVEENKTLTLERSHLNDLMGSVQRMHNDLERSGENDRRRLESQLQLLEAQVQDSRTQLTEERDNVRNVTLQKDIELKELHSRLDKTTEDLSKTREALVGAETSKKHLEDRIEDLTRQVHGSEEKLAVYERRSGTLSASRGNQDMSKEQQLEAEVAELRAELKVAKVDLQAAREQRQQFESISQAAEAALESLQSTHEQYTTSTEAQFTRLESENKAFREKLEAAQQGAVQATAKLNDLQKTFAVERTAWTNDKKTLEETIIDLSTSEKHSESDRTSREQEVRLQEERAKAAEERYSNELVAHAESRKTIEALNAQLATSQAAVRDSQVAADTATAKLAASERSWEKQKETLDAELAEVRRRHQGLTEQNKLLHAHLDDVSSQATRIKQAATSSDAPTGEGEGEGVIGDDAKLSELRSLVGYLRKDKNISELQLDLCKQENLRLSKQVDHLTETLNETRATLSEERERAVQTAASATQHAELIERINQVNVLRESNATLRAESERHAKRVKQLDVQLKELSSQLEPAKEQARVAQAELEAGKVHIQRLEEENKRWQERNTQLLSKYDRIDPVEMQTLQDENVKLKEEITALKAENVHAKTVGQKLNDNFKKFKGSMDRLRTEKAELLEEKNALTSRVQALEAEKTSLLSDKATTAQSTSDAAQQLLQETATITQLNKEKEQLISERDALLNLKKENEELKAERDKLLTEKAAAGATSVPPTDSSIEEARQAWGSEKAELVKAREEALAKAKAVEDNYETTNRNLEATKFALEQHKGRLNSTQKAWHEDKARAVSAQAAAIAAALEKQKTELENSTTSPPADHAKKHAEELKALESRLAAKYQEDLKAAVEAAKAEAAPSQGQLDAAVERGRMEISKKMALKDSQLIRNQSKLKDVETQIKALEVQVRQWHQQGFIPEKEFLSITRPTPSAAPAATPTTSSSQPSTSTTKPTPPTGPAATSTASASQTKALPNKALSGPPQRGRGGAPARGAERGRGGLAARGRLMPAAAAAQGPSLSMLGAAAKRQREETTNTSDDSLAKRLKTGDGQGAGPAGAKPVTIKRPPPPS
ncbi:hypothetical protein EV421DRAFT_2082889 [Armillaria borealis]|uniref:Nucleoprotein TPR/MLP1 domain-containing protein n=1 Tax=Armillaria borealis TaxID=47425 RepID=A0AA39JFE2_9AGAR|nr:hypothetical protein EV421DRAFT_2082889 [Armillaria borealis]